MAADALVRVYSGALVSASAPSRSLRLTQCLAVVLPLLSSQGPPLSPRQQRPEVQRGSVARELRRQL
ncbi:hypothetical protein NDU88_007241 [Pleurodeles waltl]|uniref:Uncharacterized protein n=1 Tax=Pleurodeles waltl TaxID=8319 RepID=A0AAV7SS63_PLEWA|nr:hypothetical protein NDU88_007241 [Pleurodeles waltl]